MKISALIACSATAARVSTEWLWPLSKSMLIFRFHKITRKTRFGSNQVFRLCHVMTILRRTHQTSGPSGPAPLITPPSKSSTMGKVGTSQSTITLSAWSVSLSSAISATKTVSTSNSHICQSAITMIRATSNTRVNKSVTPILTFAYTASDGSEKLTEETCGCMHDFDVDHSLFIFSGDISAIPSCDHTQYGHDYM